MVRSMPENRNQERWVVFGGAAVFFALFLCLMPRTIGFGDSGEIASAAATLGITHPPGHPGYILPAWFWTKLFGGENPGFVLNIFSAIVASVNVLLLCRLLKTASECLGLAKTSAWIRLAAAGAWTTLPFVWHYATNVEVYQLQWLFLFLFFDAFLKLGKEGDVGNWARTWIWLAMAVTVHPYSVFFVVFPAAFLVLNRRCFRLKWLIAPCLSGVLALAFYLVLPVLALRESAFQWPRGEGIGGWVSYFLAREFSHRAATGDFSQLLALQWNTTLPQILSKGIVPILVLGVVGWLFIAVTGRRLGRKLGILLGFGAIVFWTLPFFSWTLRQGLDQMIYFYCPLVFLLGAAYLAVEIVAQSWKQWRHAGALVFMLIITSSIVVYDGVTDRSDNIFPLFLAQCIAVNVPVDSLIIVKDDESYFSLLYYQYALGKRKDLTILHVDQVKNHPAFFKARHPQINILEPLPQNPRDIVASLVDANVHRRNVYWFGEDTFVAGIQEAVRYDHLVWFNPKKGANPFSFVSFYRGLLEEQRAAYAEDPVAQIVLGGIVQRMVFSLLSHGEIDRAERLAEDWLELNPGDAVATDLLARISLVKDDKERAKKLLEPLLAQPDVPTFALLTQSIILKSEKDWEARKSLLAKHKGVLNDQVNLAQDYAESLIQLGRFDEARRFLDQHPKNDALVLARVDLLYHSGEPGPAIELLEEHVTSAPWDQAALELLVYLCTIEGDEERVNRWMKEIQARSAPPVDPSDMTDEMILRQLFR